MLVQPLHCHHRHHQQPQFTCSEYQPDQQFQLLPSEASSGSEFVSEGLSTNRIGIPQVCWYCTYDWREDLGNCKFAILSLLHAT